MNRIITLLLCLLPVAPMFGQSANQMIREGNRFFKAEKFEESEESYRQALGAPRSEPVAGFNLGTSLYRQDRFEEAGRQFDAAAGRAVSSERSANAYYNLGNSLLQAGEIEKSIEAYKNALRKNPGDLSSKYNLAYARHLMKQQQEKQDESDQSEQNENEGQEQNQNQQDSQQNQEQNDEQQQQQGEAEQNQENQDEQQGQKMSREDARRLLEALAQDEKSIQEKVKKEKARANRVRTLKDW